MFLSLRDHTDRYENVNLLSKYGLWGIEYAQRHWELAEQSNTSCYSVWGHRMIAMVEAIPLFGGVVSLIERIIVFIHDYLFPATVANPNQIIPNSNVNDNKNLAPVNSGEIIPDNREGDNNVLEYRSRLGFPESMHDRDFRLSLPEDVLGRLEREFIRVAEAQKQEVDGQFFQYFYHRMSPAGTFDQLSGQSQEEKRIGTYDTAIYATQGRRDDMEDTHLAIEFYIAVGGITYPIQLFGVFDGHGGAEAAILLQTHLQRILQEQLEKFNPTELSDCGIFNALKMTFVECHKQYIDDFKTSGSTATIAMILDNKIWTANVGDSRTVLNNGGTPIALSRDAKPGQGRHLMTSVENNDVTDLASVKAHGGFYGSIIKREGSVLSNRVNRQLAVARAVGDGYIPGVTCRPKITVYPLASLSQSQDSYLVLACDGIWDVCSSSQLVVALNDHVFNNKRSLLEVAKNIAYSAYQAQSSDNLSVLLVRLAMQERK